MLCLKFINVGYGESILLQASGQDALGDAPFTMLIDGGSAEDAEYADSTTGRIRAADFLAAKGVKNIDILVLTHPHEDHVAGLERVLALGLRPKEFWTPALIDVRYRGRCFEAPGSNESGRKFLAGLNSFNRLLGLLEGQGCAIRDLPAVQKRLQDRPLFGSQGLEGLDLKVVSPGLGQAAELAVKMNELYSLDSTSNIDGFLSKVKKLDAGLNGFSLALLVTWQGKKLFLPGDATPNNADFGNPAETLSHCELIKLGHHGQKDCITDDFIRQCSPSFVVSCASSDRRYNSAAPEVYRRIEELLPGKKPIFLFSDAVPIEANTLCAGAHNCLVIDVGSYTKASTIKPVRSAKTITKTI